MACTCTNCTWWPHKVIWCTWLWYTAIPRTFTWYNQIFKKIKFSLSFYLTILGQLDNTSQRKLAHTQRFILLNYYFNSLTDNTVSTCSLAICGQSVLLVPKQFLIYFYAFPDTVVSIQLGKILTLGSRTKIYNYTTHTWMRMTILACWTTLQRSPSLIKIHVFSSFRWITRIIGTIYHKYSIFYHQLKKYPKYSKYSKQFPPI